jgi:predicted tellurium resistance membrane protein TerC
VLGIDNLVFITVLAGRLPAERQDRARQVGLALAGIIRLALLG